jgi:hypothetical protein
MNKFHFPRALMHEREVWGWVFADMPAWSRRTCMRRPQLALHSSHGNGHGQAAIPFQWYLRKTINYFLLASKSMRTCAHEKSERRFPLPSPTHQMLECRRRAIESPSLSHSCSVRQTPPTYGTYYTFLNPHIVVVLASKYKTKSLFSKQMHDQDCFFFFFSSLLL